LTKKRVESKRSSNFANIDGKDPKKQLKLFHKGVFKLQSLYFILFLYTDSYKKEVKLTLREQSQKVTVINLKNIRLADFGD
jgi:hypothetical protein